MAEKETLHRALHGVFTTERKLRGLDFTKIGISPGQPKMLAYIATNDGGMQKDIAAATGIEPPSATSILTIMERDGLIRREKADGDKRRLNVYITEKGKEKLAQIREIDKKVEALLLTGFSPAEEEQLFALLARLYANAQDFVAAATKE